MAKTSLSRRNSRGAQASDLRPDPILGPSPPVTYSPRASTLTFKNVHPQTSNHLPSDPQTSCFIHNFGAHTPKPLRSDYLPHCLLQSQFPLPQFLVWKPFQPMLYPQSPFHQTQPLWTPKLQPAKHPSLQPELKVLFLCPLVLCSPCFLPSFLRFLLFSFPVLDLEEPRANKAPVKLPEPSSSPSTPQPTESLESPPWKGPRSWDPFSSLEPILPSVLENPPCVASGRVQGSTWAQSLPCS